MTRRSCHTLYDATGLRTTVDRAVLPIFGNLTYAVAAAGAICELLRANVPALRTSAVAASYRIVAHAVAAAELATSLTTLNTVAVGGTAQAVLTVARLTHAVAA